MKLRAPQGAGDPCVAGVVIAARDDLYDVEPEIGALLIECFGFAPAESAKKPVASAIAGAPRRRPPTKKQIVGG